MKTINIKDVDLNNAYFHFTLFENLPSIEKNGLKALCGDASKLVDDKACVYLSKGGKGLLGIKNAFLYEFKNLCICEIPESYRKYFAITDYTSTIPLKKEQVYDAMKNRFEEEVYLLVQAVSGEDFLESDMHGLGTAFDIKGIEHHDIEKEKISLLVSDYGYMALDIIRYVYNILLEFVSIDIVKDMLGDLVDFFDYIDHNHHFKSDVHIGR